MEYTTKRNELKILMMFECDTPDFAQIATGMWDAAERYYCKIEPFGMIELEDWRPAAAAKPNAPEQQKDFDPRLRVVAADLVADIANGRNLPPVIADGNPLAKVEFEPVTFRHGEIFTVTSTASVS